MLKHRLVLAAAIASVAFAAGPAFASPNLGDDHTQAPVAMSGARQPDREATVTVEHPERAPIATVRHDAALAPADAPVIRAGFARVALPPVATAGFGVRITDEGFGFAAGARHGFASGEPATADHAKFGFANQ